MKQVQNQGIGVLVFPAGEVNSVELHDALSTCVNIRLYGLSSYDRHGEYVFKNYTSGAPLISDAIFIPFLNAFIAEKNIDVIFPTHDTVAEFMAMHQSEIHAKLIVADAYTAEICRDKQKTFDLFADCDFCPEVYKEATHFPSFAKPRKGQGAVGAFLMKTSEDIPLEKKWDDMVICEYLPGEEYTVDCLTDRNGTLQAVFPRSRNRLLAGITVNGKTQPITDEIQTIAKIINQRLHFKGIWYFQIKKSATDVWKLMEISTRCAGTMCLTRARGVNLALLSVYTMMGRDIATFSNTYQVTMDRTLISRYQIDYAYKKVYMDLDDTLTANGQVLLNSIRFLYQCLNDKVPVVLLTRHDQHHAESTLDYLAKCCIAPSLFTEIVSINIGKEKWEYIEAEGAIFIDNAFAERLSVHEKYDIPVFDVDGIEVLLDWRV